MRFVAAFASIVIVHCATAAHAAVIAQNFPVSPSVDPATGRLLQDGTFSDALLSGGSYYWSQAIGQSFSVGAGSTATLASLQWWGSSEYQSSSSPWTQTSLSANIQGFQVAILRTDGGPSTQFPVVQSWTIQISSVTQTLNGTFTPTTYSPVFQLNAALNGGLSLGAGNYMITVGAILTNGNGDAFAWTDGVADGSLPTTQCWATVGDVASQWGTWSRVTDGTSGAFILNGTTTPAPGAIALLAIAGSSRRRRRAE